MTGDAAAGGLHASALAVLETWRAPDTAQEALRADFVKHVRAHPDALLRSGPPAHLTASCVVLDATCTRTLLVLHAKARRWFQPGGHLEPGDGDLHAGAAREAAEETGISDLEVLPDPMHLDRHRLPDAFGRCREHLDVRFVAVAPTGAAPALSNESLGLAWFDLDRAPADLADTLEVAVAVAVAVAVPAARSRAGIRSQR